MHFLCLELLQPLQQVFRIEAPRLNGRQADLGEIGASWCFKRECAPVKPDRLSGFCGDKAVEIPDFIQKLIHINGIFRTERCGNRPFDIEAVIAGYPGEHTQRFAFNRRPLLSNGDRAVLILEHRKLCHDLRRNVKRFFHIDGGIGAHCQAVAVHSDDLVLQKFNTALIWSGVIRGNGVFHPLEPLQQSFRIDRVMAVQRLLLELGEIGSALRTAFQAPFPVADRNLAPRIRVCLCGFNRVSELQFSGKVFAGGEDFPGPHKHKGERVPDCGNCTHTPLV